jgi:hypothetical protein
MAFPRSKNPSGIAFISGGLYDRIVSRLEKLEANSRASGVTERHSGRNAAIIRVRNDLGTTLTLGTWVEIGDPIVKPGEQNTDASFENIHIFEAAATDENTTKYGVVVSQIPDKAIGKITCAGVATARANITDVDHKYLKPSSTDGVFESTNTATEVKVLWSEVGTDVKCKVIILGGAGGGEYIPINVTQVGGGPGTSGTKPDWRYDVNHAITNEQILTNVNPDQPPHTYERSPFGRVYAAKTGSGYYKEGVFIIDWVNEPKDPHVC